MPALGARVGGAHVDVNMKFDEKSLDKVGKQIHQQLARIGNRINDQMNEIGERNQNAYRAIGRDAVLAWRSALGTIVASAPLMGSAISGVAGTVTLLAGAFYSTAQSAYALAPALAAVGVAGATAFLGMKSFFQALKDNDLSDLTPSARAAAEAVQSLGDSWSRVGDTVQERIFAGLADDIERMSTTLIPVLERGLGRMADSLNRLGQSVLDYVNSASGMAVIDEFLLNSADIFDRLGKAAVPALDGLLRLLNALAPAGQRFADRVADVATRFQNWTKAEGFGNRIDAMMQRAEKTAGLLFKVLGNLGSAIANVFGAANPATNTFLEMLVDVTQRFEDWTASVGGQNSIATWAADSVTVIRQFGRTLEAVFKVFEELADPRVIASFLKTVEGAFEQLATLPLDKMVSGFVSITEAMQPLSSALLALIIAGAAINIMIGSLIGQFAGFFRVIGKLVSPLGRVFAPLSGAGKHSKELSGLAAAFARISGILARFVKFIPFVGWAVAFGSIVARSEDLRAKLGELFASVGDFGRSFIDAFREIGDALAPVGAAGESVFKWLTPLFELMEKWVGISIANTFTAITLTFQGFAKAVRGVGSLIAGFINILVGLFTLNPDKLLKGLKQLGTGIRDVFLGLGQSLLAPVLAAFQTVGEYIVDGLMQGLESIGTAIKEFGMWVIDGVKSVLRISVFAQFGMTLIQGLIQGLRTGLSALLAVFSGLLAGIRTIITSILTSIQAAFVFYFNLIRSFVSVVFTGIRVIISAAMNGIRAVVSGAWGLITAVVTNSLNFIRAVVSKVFGSLVGIARNTFNGVRTAISTAWTGITGVVNTGAQKVVDAVRAIPGKMLALGRLFLDAGKNVIGKFVEGMRNASGIITGIAGSVWDAVRSLINGAIDKINAALEFEIDIPGPNIKVNIQNIPHLAKGTNFHSGGVALVGEEGPELVDLPRGSKVKTARQTRALANGASGIDGSGTSVVVHQNFYGPTTGSSRLRELDWTLRFATRARSVEGLAGS